MEPSATARAAAAAVSRDARTLAALVASDPDPKVRAVALAALVRSVPRAQAGAVWQQAAADPHPGVRHRAAELAPRLGRAAPCRVLVTLLADRDSWVAEAAAFALGEHPRVSRRALTELMHAAASHHDPLVREAAVAALGARGDPATRAAVLAACDDKPAIRRRAVLALAAFDGPDVEARLRAALGDPDWQVRQAAEDLLAGPDVTP